MDKTVEVTENVTVDNELEGVLGCLSLENPVLQLNQ